MNGPDHSAPSAPEPAGGALVDEAAAPPEPPATAGHDRANDAAIASGVRWVTAGLVGLLFFKLGGVSSAHYGPVRWQPWTWRPGPLFRNSLPTGGDMGAHVWAPDFLRRELLPHLRLSGWSKDWYAGFPVPTFYFPLPLWMITLLGFVLGPNVAFKLVSVSGLLALPLVANRLAVRAGAPRLDAGLFALGAFAFLVDPHFAILGGNILSTMAGEFSFSISLALAVTFLGILVRFLRTGRGAPLLPCLLAATAVSHLLPMVFASVSALIIVAVHLIGRRADDAPERRGTLVALVACAALSAALMGFWLLPFATNLNYTTDMGWAPATNYVASLFPPLLDEMQSGAAVAGGVVVLGLLGGLHQLVRFLHALAGRRTADARARLGTSLLLMAGAAALAFRFMPADRILNERALPFWFLSLSLLAGYGVLTVAGAVAAAAAPIGPLLRRGRRGQKTEHDGTDDAPAPAHRHRGAIRATTVLWVAGLLTWWGPGSTFGVLPGAVPIPKLDKHGLGIQRASSTTDHGFASEWANYNYNGYQGLGKDWDEYHALVTVMRRVAAEHGCGRAMWDYEDQLDRYGTSMGMMLLPYWTKGCIGSMEGLYFESSASVPYHFVNASLLSGSGKSSDPVSYVTYPGTNVEEGVRKLQAWGVRYYLAFAPDVQRQAHVNPDLTLLATSPYHRDCEQAEIDAATCPTTWEIYEVRDAPLVAGLATEPAVLTGIGQGQTGGWLDVAIRQYAEPATFPVPFAADGPASWQRVPATAVRNLQTNFGAGVTVGTPTARTLPAVAVTGIEETDGTVRFRVDRTGVPVVVKVSYYPNWTADGADGPYRLAPNLMVVIPTSNQVTMHFTRGRPETLGLLLSVLGAAGVGAWAWRRRRGRTAPTAAPAAPVAPADPTDAA